MENTENNFDYIEKAKEIYQNWERHKTYIANKNLINVCNESVNFYEGNHYYKMKHLVDLPKVVFNVVKMIIDNKVSNILATPFSCKFTSADDPELADRLNNFDKYILKELDHDIINRRLVNDGEIKGTFALHYYWNENLIGQVGIYKGGLQAELLDPINIACENPRERDIQKQKWIIIPKRLEAKVVKKMCDEGVDLELIKPDDLETVYDNDKEAENSDKEKGLVTVFTRYFRVDGEVYYDRATKETLIQKPKPLNPEIHYKDIKYNSEDDREKTDEDLQMDSQKITQDEDVEFKDDDQKFYLYPIEVNCLTPSDSGIYGLSDVYSLITPQKMLNLSFASQYKRYLDDLFPKWLVKKGALQQEITGMPNEVITDNSNTNGWGIAKVEGGSIANAQFTVSDTITEFMKVVSNSRDVLNGDSVGANMSALAIQSLQTQAEKPIAQQRELFMMSLVRMARIRILFYKFFYEEKNFSYELNDIDFEEELEHNNYVGVNKTRNATFKGSDLKHKALNITVDVGRGTKYDAITAQETLNSLFVNGAINNMDADRLEQFYEMLDDNLFPNKENLKRIIRKQRQSENTMLKQQVEQLTTDNQELQIQLEQAKVMISTLQDEFKQKIEFANEKIKTSEANLQNANNLIAQIYKGNTAD